MRNTKSRLVVQAPSDLTDPALVGTFTCHCSAEGKFGYHAANGLLTWFCAEHRPAKHYADERRELTQRKPADSRGYPRPPDLQELVERFGGYDKITPAAWREIDEAMRQWHEARRIYTAGHVINNSNERSKRGGSAS